MKLVLKIVPLVNPVVIGTNLIVNVFPVSMILMVPPKPATPVLKIVKNGIKKPFFKYFFIEIIIIILVRIWISVLNVEMTLI